MKPIIFLILFSTQIFSKDLTGNATTPDGTKQIYTEVHEITLDEKGLNKKIETKYFSPEKKLIAQMTSDFAKNPTIPEVKFIDLRFEKTEELYFKENQSEVVIFKTTQKNKDSKIKEIKVTKNMAAGQGFDNFVKINFEEMKNKTVPLSFGVLSKMDFYSFNGYQKSESKDNVVQFGIDLASFFLRVFTSELVLEYNSQTRQILSYRGLSNLLTEVGETQDVLIKYQVAPVETTL